MESSAYKKYYDKATVRSKSMYVIGKYKSVTPSLELKLDAIVNVQ